jgi:hypothetical protein
MTKARVKTGLLGLGYGTSLTIWGTMTSGGGHWMFPIALALSPIPFGFLVWPIVGFLAADLSSMRSKLVFLCVFLIHYIGLAVYIMGDQGSGDLYWFRIGAHRSDFLFAAAVSVLMYVGGQILCWFRFAEGTRMALSKAQQ